MPQSLDSSQSAASCECSATFTNLNLLPFSRVADASFPLCNFGFWLDSLGFLSRSFFLLWFLSFSCRCHSRLMSHNSQALMTLPSPIPLSPHHLLLPGSSVLNDTSLLHHRNFRTFCIALLDHAAILVDCSPANIPSFKKPWLINTNKTANHCLLFLIFIWNSPLRSALHSLSACRAICLPCAHLKTTSAPEL